MRGKFASRKGFRAAGLRLFDSRRLQRFSIHLARVRLTADELPHDHHVALAARAADTQDDGSSFGTADRSDCSIETEVRNARAVDGNDLVTRGEARVGGAGGGNQLLDLQRVGPRAKGGSGPGTLQARVGRRFTRGKRDLERRSIAVPGEVPE